MMSPSSSTFFDMNLNKKTAGPLNEQSITLQNIIFKSEYDALLSYCKAESVFLVPLKGISFFNRIYKLSDRQLTDVDVYTPKKDFKKLQEILLKLNYLERIEDKWYENEYKHTFTKDSAGLEVVVEVHTQLTPKAKNDHWRFINTSLQTLLHPEDELVYLCYHYVHQHTLLNDKWLTDIYLISLMNPTLWSKSLWDYAQRKQMTNSLIFSAIALNVKYNLKMPIPGGLVSYIARGVLNIEFIEQSRKHFLKYFFVKQIAKGRLKDAFFYNLRWFIFSIKKRL